MQVAFRHPGPGGSLQGGALVHQQQLDPDVARYQEDAGRAEALGAPAHGRAPDFRKAVPQRQDERATHELSQPGVHAAVLGQARGVSEELRGADYTPSHPGFYTPCIKTFLT